MRCTDKCNVIYWKSISKPTDLWFLDPAALGIPATNTSFFQIKQKILEI